ncbi:diguanylate cyclase [Mycolicibacterium neoaurum]|uniref:diguanylate cyclase domain-containing protein n=1 Tax=Mycolicibacterium neoaurum TaxID=1795 RepID=UPI001BCF3768|nr:diguanylate cyclase [Mycolicibacterium neoaurum]QVI29687.1 diguanylate cyclase [Mycolicibacterium neoaurum]
MDLSDRGASFLDTLCRTVRTALDCRQAMVLGDRTDIPPSAMFLDDARRQGFPVPSALGEARFVAAVPVVVDTTVDCALWVADPRPRTITAVLRDQLETFGSLAAQHLQLAAAASLYRLVAENSADTLIRGSMDGIRRYVSPSIRSLLGYEATELVGRRASDITHPEDVGAFGRKMLAMREGEVDSFTTEHRMRHKDGSWVWIEAFVRVTRDTGTDERDGYVVSVRDTSRRKELEKQLVHNASHDPLTGLPNRALLYQRLAERIARATPFALLCIDLDGFKQVNDQLGHSAGDIVLTTVAERLVASVRTGDTVARRGGDEFVVILCDAPLPESAMALGRRLIDTASAPMTVGDWTGAVGLSVGIAIGGAADDAEELLLVADRAMYEAKAAGRNGCRLAAIGD